MVQRILALIIKELTVLWKDKRTRGVLLVPPLVQVCLFAYAATYDVSHAPLAVWSEDAGPEAAELVRRFAASPSFHLVASPDRPSEVARLIDTRAVAAVLHVGPRFDADLKAGRAPPVQLLLDARRSNTALLLDGYAQAIVAAFAADRAGAGMGAGGAPIRIETRDWFNPTLESQWFVLPGLVAILSFVLTTLVSALALARERELGTLEQMLVTPLRPMEIVIGKGVPAVIVGLLEAHIVIAAAILWFRVPFVGSPLVLEGALLVFALAATGLGLAISAFAQTQQQAILAVFVFNSPAIILSGYATPVENMPPLFEAASRADPLRYMLVLARGLFLQNPPIDSVLSQIWPMAVIAAVLMVAAVLGVRRVV